MIDPISFTATTPRFRLPLLFTGQSQKEFTVNEAHALTDALLHPACEGEASTPPSAPIEGETWIVGDSADGDWAGETGQLAAWQAGTWLFIAPREGMRLYDKSTGQVLIYRDTWRRPAAPEMPTGGSTIDGEARDAIAALAAVLVEAGILPQD